MLRTIRYTAPLVGVSDYIVLDTETTGVDPQTDKIVEVGMIEVRNNVIVDRFGSFVNPSCPIPAAASRVNHIYAADVADAPTYEQIAPTLARWLIGKVVVAHNARFDIALVKGLLESQNYSGTIRYIDTLYYARRAIDGVDNYKLQTLAEHLGIGPGNAHRAVDDAITCHHLFQICKKQSSDASFSQKPVDVGFDTVRAADITPSHPVLPGGPLYDKVVVFTGDFSVPLREAMQKAIDSGAVVKDNLTLDADFLVEGTQNPALVGSGGKSRKQQRAAEINSSGKGHIRIISEAEFDLLCRGDTLQKHANTQCTTPAPLKTQPAPKPAPARINLQSSAPTHGKIQSALKLIWVIIQWFLAVAIFVMAIVLASSSVFSALLLLLCAVLCTPIRKLRDMLVKIHIKGFWIVLLSIVFFLTAVILSAI